MPYFKPFEIFQQETTNGVMGALLISDVLFQEKSAVSFCVPIYIMYLMWVCCINLIRIYIIFQKNPKNKQKFGVKNPLEIFKFNSVHGGVWRCAYQVDSIGETSVIIHFLGGPKLFLYVVATIFAAIAFGILKVTGRI